LQTRLPPPYTSNSDPSRPPSSTDKLVPQLPWHYPIMDGIDSIVLRMKSTRVLSIQGPAMANTTIAAISFGTKASVASCICVTA